MSRARFRFRARDKNLDLGVRTRLMGILNLTPDSFSDGGLFTTPDEAIAHGLRLIEEGAEILDIGGESTRPNSEPVSESLELSRVLPVIEEIRGRTPAMLSVDTYKSGVAWQALQAGADVVNDISGFLFDEKMPEVVSRFRAGVVLMQIRGTPSTMQTQPPSEDILEEVKKDLQVAVNKAYKSSIPHDRIVLDPGIGFGKSAEENLVIFNRLSEFADLNLPVLVGPSRKSFIGRILNRAAGDRLMGTAAACAASVLNGAHLLRVHDVAEIRQIADTIDAILAEQIET